MAGPRILAGPQRELRLLQPPRLECRLQVHGRTSGHADLGLRSVGVAVPQQALLPSLLWAGKVQLRARVFHAMIRRLEVLQYEYACLAELLLCFWVKDTAAHKWRDVDDAVFGQVSAVRV
jgi:hypothetical protein